MIISFFFIACHCVIYNILPNNQMQLIKKILKVVKIKNLFINFHHFRLNKWK